MSAYASLYYRLQSLKSATSDETNGRHLLTPLIVDLCQDIDDPEIFDAGAGYGADLFSLKRSIPTARLSALESYPNAVASLRRGGVRVSEANLERDPLPFPDNGFDVVLCNQVLEHVKELFWVVSELTRVCKLGGYLVLGVPNLGSLHNRIALLLGKQPPAIHVFGPHVRGFTHDGLRDFLHSAHDLLCVQRILGGNFYPFPPVISRSLSRWFPGLAVSAFFVVRKQKDSSFLDVLNGPRASELVDTPYFRR